jgi:hypothetical protein
VLQARHALVCFNCWHNLVDMGSGDRCILISKTTFLQFQMCPKDTWLKLHKPELHRQPIGFGTETLPAIIRTHN